jgi:hypothetical protein
MNAHQAMPVPPWAGELFRVIDEKNTARFVEFLADDARFRFGNLPALEGKAAIGAGVGQFFASIRALRHCLLDSWERDGSLVCRGEVTYTRHDGREVTVPFTNVFYLSAGRIRDYQIYVDLAPLYASGG